MPFAAIPGVEQIGKPIITKASELAQNRQTKQPREPGISGRPHPDLECTIGADKELPLCIETVQPAPDVLDAGAKPCERFRFQVDVAEFDRTGTGRAHETVPLPANAAIANGTFRIVPDG